MASETHKRKGDAKATASGEDLGEGSASHRWDKGGAACRDAARAGTDAQWGAMGGGVWEPGPRPTPPGSLPSAAVIRGLLASRCAPASHFPWVISSRALIFCRFGRSRETKRVGAAASS